MLKIVKNKIINLINNINWHLNSYSLKKEEYIKAKEFNEEIYGKRILVVAPHADDELIGCYSILNNRANMIDVYYSGYTGHDESAQNINIRKEEIVKLTNKLNVNLLSDNPKNREVFKRLSIDNYDVIMLPSIIDWHWQHRELCMDFLKKVDNSNRKCDVYFYMVTVPFPSKYVNMFNYSTINKWIIFKKIYKSQLFMPIRRFKCVEKSYSINKRKNARIEPYINIKDTNIKNIIKNLDKIDIKELDFLFSEINNLKNIRKKSYNLYDRIMNL